MTASPPKPLAVWAVTPAGAALGRRLAPALNADLHLCASAGETSGNGMDTPEAAARAAPTKAGVSPTAPSAADAVHVHPRLGPAVAEHFSRYEGHVFLMACGIVLRSIAPLLVHKLSDPAVVVMDELGKNAISLLSGHVGGANDLTRRVAALCGAMPVITTATDLHDVPAIDVIATQRGLVIENSEAIRHVSMALLAGRPIRMLDPFNQLQDALPPESVIPFGTPAPDGAGPEKDGPGVVVDFRIRELPPSVLVLRPRILVAGMGCNRGADVAELRDLLLSTLAAHHIAPASLSMLATTSLKRDEPGLLALARERDIPIGFFDNAALEKVQSVPHPSETVKRHIGVPSVCEASAMLAAKGGPLLIPKHKTPNATVAVARTAFTSWVSAPETGPTSADAPSRP